MAVVAELLRLRDRAAEIGEHDAAHGRLGVRCAGRRDDDRAEQLIEWDVGIDLDDRRRAQTVRFLVHTIDRLFALTFRETEDRAVVGVEPVRVVVHAVLAFDREVHRVRLRHLFRRGIDTFVAVEEHRHDVRIQRNVEPGAGRMPGRAGLYRGSTAAIPPRSPCAARSATSRRCPGAPSNGGTTTRRRRSR